MTMAYMDSNSNSSTCSSSSDEPLVRYREIPNNVPDGNYDSLIRQIKQNCDICDKVFPDRYSAIIHNNSHIIIPLMKISVVQCSKCHKLEPSQEDLYLHMIVEHRDVGLQEKITNKILFEDDIIDDVQVKVEDDNVCDLNNDVDNDVKDDTLIHIREEDVDESDFRSLIKFGLHKCRFCNDIYSSRFKLLQHNIEHMAINTSCDYLCGHCERFFASDFDLDLHLVVEHDGVMIKTMQHCYSCKLPYSDLLKHYKLYHLPPPEETVRCRSCNEDIKQNDLRKHWLDHRDTLYICDICQLFIKNSVNIKYIKIGIHSVEGERSDCQKCGHEFFDLNIIKRFRYNNKIKRKYTFKAKPVLNMCNFNQNKNKPIKKALSNMERLKNIQNRLKIIKHLNKF